MNSSIFKLIIGLGNPDLPAARHGEKYENTYHNVGFLFIDCLKSQMLNVKCPACAEASAGRQILKSEVYMNESGAFVKKALKKASAKPEELLVVHDDSDLELGKYKFSFGRGAAGHHGIENIMATLKTKNFWRLRIGIRPPAYADERRLTRGLTRKKASEFVLKKISGGYQRILIEVFKKAASEFKSYSK